MPTVALNYGTVKSGIGKKLSDDELKERIAMLGTDLESLSKESIVVEVFPNRPDLLAEFGFIRALRSFIGVEKGLREYSVKSSGLSVNIKPSVSKVRPYTACAIVKGLKLTDEKIEQIIQLQEKLHVTHCRNRSKAAIGIYPSEKIKYPITFCAEDPKGVSFVPLGDTKPMNGLQILSRHKTGRDFGHLLEGKEKFPFFIDAKGDVLSMPPIINSELTGKVTTSTKEVFIECSGFDLDFLKELLNIIICELADMGGQIFSMSLNYPDKKIVTPNLKPVAMKLDEAYVQKLLGQKVNIKECLERMGFSYSNGTVLIPSYRVDVLHPMDIVEDIAIAHGYENFEPELPVISTIGEEARIERFRKKIAELLVGLELNEVTTFSVSNERIQNTMMGQKEKIIEFSNSKSSEYSALRQSIIPSMMEVLQLNAKNEYPQRIFEMGAVFYKDKNEETGVREDLVLGVALCGKNEDFTRARQIIEHLLKSFNLGLKLEEITDTRFIPGRVGKLLVGGKQIGIIGEIHPTVLVNFRLEMPVAVFEINLGTLQAQLK